MAAMVIFLSGLTFTYSDAPAKVTTLVNMHNDKGCLDYHYCIATKFKTVFKYVVDCSGMDDEFSKK